MFSIVFGAYNQTFLNKNPLVDSQLNQKLRVVNLTVTCLDLACLVTCIVVGALHTQMGFNIPPTVQWTLIEVGIGGIAILAYKKVLPSLKDDSTST